jgi:hypothetical protein
MFVSDEKWVVLASREESEGGGGTYCTYIVGAVALATFGGSRDGGDGGGGGDKCHGNGQLDEWFHQPVGTPFDNVDFLLDIASNVVGSSFNPLSNILFVFLSPGAASDFVGQAERDKKEEGEDLA